MLVFPLVFSFLSSVLTRRNERTLLPGRAPRNGSSSLLSGSHTHLKKRDDAFDYTKWPRPMVLQQGVLDPKEARRLGNTRAHSRARRRLEICPSLREMLWSRNRTYRHWPEDGSSTGKTDNLARWLAKASSRLETRATRPCPAFCYTFVKKKSHTHLPMSQNLRR